MGYCRLITADKEYKKYLKKKYGKKNYWNKASVYNLIKYVLTDKSTGDLVRYGAAQGTVFRDILEAVYQMKLVKCYYGKEDKVQMHHFILSFGEIKEPCEVWEVGREIMDKFFYGYQVVFGVHEDTEHLHIHFAVNSVSMLTGKKWHMDREEFREFVEGIERMSDEHFDIWDGRYCQAVGMEDLL